MGILHFNWRQTAVLTGFVLAVAPLHAATFYVSTTGNDANGGTSSAPWRTLGKANVTLRAGDTVLVMPGTYAERIDPAYSGTETAPITYKAFNSTRPKIVGKGSAQSWLGAVANLDRTTSSSTVFL